jgi:hypothetical protein
VRIQTDPTQRASIREDQHIQQRRIQTPYSEGFHQMRQPPNHRKSKEKTNRHYIRKEPAAADQSIKQLSKIHQ